MPAPPMPPKPPLPEESPRSTASTASIFMALMMLGITMAGLGFVVLGPVFAVVVLGLLFIPMVMFMHYLVWGWWLGKIVQFESEEENAWDIYNSTPNEPRK